MGVSFYFEQNGGFINICRAILISQQSLNLQCYNLQFCYSCIPVSKSTIRFLASLSFLGKLLNTFFAQLVIFGKIKSHEKNKTNIIYSVALVSRYGLPLFKECVSNGSIIQDKYNIQTHSLNFSSTHKLRFCQFQFNL